MNLFDIIKQKVSILSLVNEYVTIKKSGSYYKGRCPFHSERTASFTVSPDKEIFYCFGCHVGGDVIYFVSKLENCSQVDAAKIIADKYNINIDKEIGNINQSDLSKKKIYIKTNEIFLAWAHKNLLENNNISDIAKNYLSKRNINKNSIELFKLGFVPRGYNFLKDLVLFAKKNNILIQDLLEAKILFENKQGYFCPFEDRIIFPIKDHFGNIVGFGGRIFKEADDRVKYYNSHDNIFFNKSELLFALDIAKKNIQEKNAVFLVEGYMDAISMIQHGFINTVATLGTACSQKHLKLLSRYTQRLYIIYDQDDAGQKAILRLVESCWQNDIDLYVINLPKGEDPDSFLKKNNDLKLLILKAKDIFNFYLEFISKDFANKSLKDRILATRKLIDIILNIKDILKQDLLLKQASEKFNIPFDTLKSLLNKDNSKNLDLENKINKNEEDIININKISQLEKNLFSAIIYNDKNFNLLDYQDYEFLKNYFSEPIKSNFNKIIAIKNYDNLSDQDKSIISRILIESNVNIDSIGLKNLVLQFYKKKWRYILDNIKAKIYDAQKNGEIDLVNNLLIELDLIKNKILKKDIYG